MEGRLLLRWIRSGADSRWCCAIRIWVAPLALFQTPDTDFAIQTSLRIFFFAIDCYLDECESPPLRHRQLYLSRAANQIPCLRRGQNGCALFCNLPSVPPRLPCVIRDSGMSG